MNVPAFETIRLDRHGPVAVITLNRPDRLNTFTVEMLHELLAAFDLTDGDDDVRAVVVTGAGPKAFCAGLELGESENPFDFGDTSPGAVVGGIPRDIGGRLTLRIFNSLKPVIAAVQGASVGIGATMQLAMDVRFAATSARYSFLFAKRGIVPEAASSWFLPRLVGIQTALDWCFTGRMVDADEALRGGLVKQIFPTEALLEGAIAYAAEIAENTAPVSIALTRQMMWRMLGANHPMEAHRLDSRAIFERGRSADALEGVASFLERRPAIYPDRVSTDMPSFVPWWHGPEFE